jgi:hypothetical protein
LVDECVDFAGRLVRQPVAPSPVLLGNDQNAGVRRWRLNGVSKKPALPGIMQQGKMNEIVRDEGTASLRSDQAEFIVQCSGFSQFARRGHFVARRAQRIGCRVGDIVIKQDGGQGYA